MTQAATRHFVFLIVTLAVLATIAVAIVAPGLDKDSLQVAGLFGLLGVLAHALAYQRPTKGAGSANISFIPFLSAVGIAPTLVVVVAVAMAVLVAELLQRREIIKGVFNVA